MEDEPPQVDAAMAELRRKIVEIEKDTTLSAADKALRRQQVMSSGYAAKGKAPAEEAAGGSGDAKGASASCSGWRTCAARHGRLAAKRCAADSASPHTQAKARAAARWP
jgi:hypothetical protein